MDNNLVIKVNNISKVYKLYHSPLDRLKESLSFTKRSYHKDFYALKNISFDINKGEIIGVIGKNGSGKSTLLKIITGVLTPSSGSIEVKGKVSALLELGAGFNPEYSGIENIYFQGNLMGYSKNEMDTKIEDIIRFADIGDFIYQPVKNYSSGMFARLAFAVAINVEPDILIIDEALAVGDMLFQAKCMSKMTALMKSGVTVLFVSHDAHSIKTLCQKAIYLNDGVLIDYGNSADVVGQYVRMQHMRINEELHLNVEEEDITENTVHILDTQDKSIPNVVSLTPKTLDSDISKQYGDGRASIINAIILDEEFNLVSELVSNGEYYVQVAIRFHADLKTFVCGFSLSSLDGVQQLGWTNLQDAFTFPPVKVNEVFVVTAKIKVPIREGTYNLSVGVEYPIISNQQHQFLDVIMNFSTVRVVFQSSAKIFFSMFYTPAQYYLRKL